jgi:hypothetical protein
MLENYFAKRRIRKLFGKYISQDGVEKLLSGKTDDSNPIKPAKVEFIFLLLRDTETSEQLSKRIEEVTIKCHEFSATVFDICGPLMITGFSGFHVVADAATKRLVLAGQLRLQLGDHIKLVHGMAEGHQGLFGGRERCSYTFTFPGFAKALAELTQLDFGEMSEFKP